MSSSEPLETRARRRAERAFVRGRVGAALRVLWVPAIMIVIAVLRGHSWGAAIALGAGLALAAGYLRYRGGVFERAVGPALIAGITPLVVPMAYCPMGATSVGGVAVANCTLLCTSAGLVAGAVLAAFSLGVAPDARLRFGLAAMLVAGLAGSLGCSLVGLGGVLGMAAGMMVIAAPASLLLTKN